MVESLKAALNYVGRAGRGDGGTEKETGKVNGNRK